MYQQLYRRFGEPVLVHIVKTPRQNSCLPAHSTSESWFRKLGIGCLVVFLSSWSFHQKEEKRKGSIS